MVEMELVGVRVELPSNAPIVLLRESAGLHRTLPIFIGGPEATAIAFALEGVETPRPLTHDLIKDLLEALGFRLERIVVTELRDSTFFAELHLRGSAEGSHVVSSRPSDAIALAVRTSTPIFADEAVLDEAAYPPEEPDGEEAQDEVVEQFRDFIEHVNPEDFAS